VERSVRLLLDLGSESEVDELEAHLAERGWRTMKLSKADERLRRESPAYRPDDNWEELEPQSMQVVLSVRFDPGAARRIGQLAHESGELPSGLIRTWILERLDSIDGAGMNARASGVREAASAYETGSIDHEELRGRYRPKKIDLLLVGESRPAGGTFFYLANSNLFYATHEAFQAALGPMPSGVEFLRFVQDRGVWLYDLADKPVDRLAGRPRRSAVQGRIGELVSLLRQSRPRRVVAIKKDLAPMVRLALDEADLSIDRLTVLPFPLYQWRAEYVRSLAAIISDAPIGR
jgi:hypothetical protein